jgi:integrase
MNLELRNRVWYATILVPVDVREALGKVRFKQSLGTSNRLEAERLKGPIIAHWKAQIRQARGSINAVSSEALRWKAALNQAPDEETKEEWQLHLSDVAERKAKTQGYEHAKEFHDIATGALTPSNQYFDTWKDSIQLIPKTKEQMIKDVGLLVTKFPTLEGINRASVRRWIDGLEAEGKTRSSVDRILSFCRNYWRYLQRYDAVSREATPFNGVTPPKPKTKGGKKNTNLPYHVKDVVKLWEAASKRPMGQAKNAHFDTQLADLIKLGAYTGARIEELCSLKLTTVTEDTIKIEDAKTPSGWRTVPIHSQIDGLVKKLKKDSKDGYLLSGLTFNKFKDRSNAIGKRFGRLKKELGFAPTHTFHSFRSTVATLLEDAKVPEGIAADIIGHDKPSMTYGLYSGGASIETKREALEKVHYPFPK